MLLYLFFVKKELKVFFLALEIFLSSFSADVKKLLKWFADKKSSEVVLLSIFKVIWLDPVLKIFMLISFYTIPYSFRVFFIGFKVCFEVVFLAKTIQSYYLSSEASF